MLTSERLDIEETACVALQQEVALDDGARITRFPIGLAYGKVFLSFAAQAGCRGYGEDGFSSLRHVRVEQNGQIVPPGGGGGGGSDDLWTDHIEFDLNDFQGSVFDIVYFDDSGEVARETVDLDDIRPQFEWRVQAPRRIQLMNEYGVEWPLWEDEHTSPDDYPQLTSSLVDELRAWAKAFLEHFDWKTGWPTDFDSEYHRLEGRRLAERLRSELGDDFVVTFDDWTSPAE
ncbi:hypothetical protein [Aeromicrobium terrae]|uniref:Uncharacterized protein n=1 Tax=Aeromicrobium terrae TaxID=2498846 RepID=A0A5C8NE46_9ACTN|nr:hypothetical protein [Aeromicrobium terrae]TXL57877.1 hypothetical protein FHP06_11065 [Aeromicrobium terrae]